MVTQPLQTRQFGAGTALAQAQSHHHGWYVAGLTFLAMGLRGTAARLILVISKDGTVYAANGAHFAAGRFQDGLASFFPPGYSVLIGLASVLNLDPEAAGQLVSVVVGALGTVPLYLLARRLVGPSAALAAAFIYAVHPIAVRYGGEVLSEATYVTLLLTGCALALRALSGRRPVSAVFLGGVSGAAYMVRPEGLGLLFVATAACLLPLLPIRFDPRSRQRPPISESRGPESWRAAPRRIAVALCIVAGFLIVAGPYLVYLRSFTGGWTLSQKLGATVAVGLMAQQGITGEELHDRAATLMKREEIEGFKTVSFVLRNAPRFARKAAGDIFVVLRFYIEMLYLPLALLALLGVAARTPARQETAGGGLMLALLIFYLVAFSLLLTQRRYMLPLAMISLPWAGRGWVRARDWLWQRPLIQRRKAPAAWAAAIMVAVVLTASLPVAIRTRRQDKVAYKETGLWIRAHHQSKQPIMTNMPRIAYYAVRPVMRIPLAPLDEVAAKARAAGARLLVVDSVKQEKQHPNFQVLAKAANLQVLKRVTRRSAKHPHRAILVYLVE